MTARKQILMANMKRKASIQGWELVPSPNPPMGAYQGSAAIRRGMRTSHTHGFLGFSLELYKGTGRKSSSPDSVKSTDLSIFIIIIILLKKNKVLK